MRFGVILALIQGWLNQGLKYALLSTDSELNLGTHLRDKHGHLFLCDLEIFWPAFKVGQTKFENMHFCPRS